MYEAEINKAYVSMHNTVDILAMARNHIEINDTARLAIGNAISHAESNFDMLGQDHNNPIKHLDDCFAGLQEALAQLGAERKGIDALAEETANHFSTYSRLLKEAEGQHADVSQIDGTRIVKARKAYETYLKPEN